MPSGKHKSGSVRKIFRKTPGNRNVIHYEEKRPSKAQCGICGRELAGVPRATKAELANMPKTSKRPERPYGGVLCSPCSRKVIKSETRNK